MTEQQHHPVGAGDVMDRLRAARPVSDADVDVLLAQHGRAALDRALPGPARRALASEPWDGVDHQAVRVERHAQVVTLATARRGTRRRRAWSAAAAGIAAAAVVAIAVTGQQGTPAPSGHRSSIVVATDQRAAATAPAGTTLIALASAARTDQQSSGTVAYTATTDAYRTDPATATLTASSTQLWKAPDGSGRLDAPVVNAGQGSAPAPQRDEQTWAPGGSPDAGSWRAGVIDDLVVADLPATADALAAAVRTWAQAQPPMIGGQVPGTVADAELDLLGALLAEPTATPAQRAAAFEVLAARDDVGLLGEHTDPLGRAGTAVEYDLRSSGTYRVTLTFDTATSVLLSREDALVDAGTGDGSQPPGTALGPWSWTAWKTTAMVDAVGDVPAGTTTP